MMTQKQTDVTQIRADQLTEGDIIRHSTEEEWLICTEPQYTQQGIVFCVLPLELNTSETQEVAFNPSEKFELIQQFKLELGGIAA